MINWLKKYFIPHPENDHKPHFFRTEAFVFSLVFVFLIEVVYLVPVMGIFSRSNFFAEILSSVLVDSANVDRQKLNEQSLRVNPTLVQAAQLKANDMATKGYFAHTSPTGVTPWYWFAQAGYKYSRAGENLAVNFVDSNQLHQAWMTSPTHRANIVNGYYSEIGIATAKGMYKGQEAVFVVELFGQPSKVAIQPAPSPIPPKPSIRPSATPVVAGQVQAANVDLVQTSSEPTPTNDGTGTQYSSFTERILSEPKTVADSLVGLGLIIILLALCLTIFIKIEFQNPRLIINGLIIFVVLIGVLIINQYFSTGTISAGIS